MLLLTNQIALFQNSQTLIGYSNIFNQSDCSKPFLFLDSRKDNFKNRFFRAFYFLEEVHIKTLKDKH